MSQKIQLPQLHKINNIIRELKRQYPSLTKDNIVKLTNILDAISRSLKLQFKRDPSELELFDSIKAMPEMKHLFTNGELLFTKEPRSLSQEPKNIKESSFHQKKEPTLKLNGSLRKINKIDNVARRLQGSRQPLTRENYTILMDVLTTTNREINKLFGQEPTEQELFDSIKDMPEVKHLFPYECFLHDSLRFQFTRLAQPNDNNCLFHALGTALNINHIKVRQDICTYMKTNRHIFFSLPWFEDILESKTFDEYITTMEMSGTWGGVAEIYAASINYNRPITVFGMDGIIVSHFDSDINGLIMTGEPIYLYWCNREIGGTGVHYELLVPNEDMSQGASQSEDYEQEYYPSHRLHQLEQDELLARELELGLGLQQDEEAMYARGLGLQQDEDAMYARKLELEELQKEKDALLARSLANQYGGIRQGTSFEKYLKYKHKYLTLKRML
jgi:hypothetical protein